MRWLGYGLIIALSTAGNFFIFIISYRVLTFPYIQEEQRVSNAPYIFIYVLPAFLLVSMMVVIVGSILVKKYRDVI